MCTALYEAAQCGKLTAAQVLLAAGAQTGIRRTNFEDPALHVAAQNGDVKSLRALLEHGVDLDSSD